MKFFHFVYMFFAFIALFIFPTLFVFCQPMCCGFLAIGKKLHDPHSLYIYAYLMMHEGNNFVNDYKCFELYLFLF